MDDENGTYEPVDEPVIGDGGGGGLPPEYDPPEAATPSAYLYRGSLLALAVGSFVALYLVLSPPASEADVDAPREISTNTPAFLETATPTPPGSPPATTATPGEGTPTVAPEATPTATPAGGGQTTEYEVQPGETLSEIAADFGVTVDAIVAANPGLDPDNVGAGEVIQIPVADE